MHQVYLALGSNVGDRCSHMQWAVRQFAGHRAIFALVPSPIYESDAHVLKDAETQPAYLNAVMGLKTMLSPDSLLQLANGLEKLRGRNRAGEERWASRTLDIDILVLGDIARQSNNLQIPHPRLHERNFVLAPWADIAPGFVVPAPFKATVKALLANCADAGSLIKTSYNLLD